MQSKWTGQSPIGNEYDRALSKNLQYVEVMQNLKNYSILINIMFSLELVFNESLNLDLK